MGLGKNSHFVSGAAWLWLSACHADYQMGSNPIGTADEFVDIINKSCKTRVRIPPSPQVPVIHLTQEVR